MRHFRPRAELRERIISIDVVEAPASTLDVLPSTSAVLGFQFRGRVESERARLSGAGVTGIQSELRRYSYVGETGSVLVRFTPQGATCLGLPAGELASRSLALSDWMRPALVEELGARISGAASAEQRVALVERFLLSLPFRRDPLVARALARLEPRASGEEAARVAALARDLGLSERQLERRFLERVGVTPKRFAALRRFELALELAREAPTLAQAALAAGYFDQAHLNRDFRRFAGVAPGVLLRRERARGAPAAGDR